MPDKKQLVLAIFRDYQNKTITENILIERLNKLHDDKIINDEDREVLGWMFTFRYANPIYRLSS